MRQKAYFFVADGDWVFFLADMIAALSVHVHFPQLFEQVLCQVFHYQNQITYLRALFF